MPYEFLYPDAINPIYPELLLPLFRLGKVYAIVIKSLRVKGIRNHTDHGALRSNQRSVSQKDVQEAIKTAKQTGNITTKIGKYGTPQNHYKGSNGLTVVQETQGRNAGKIITVWWSK